MRLQNYDAKVVLKKQKLLCLDTLEAFHSNCLIFEHAESAILLCFLFKLNKLEAFFMFFLKLLFVAVYFIFIL